MENLITKFLRKGEVDMPEEFVPIPSMAEIQKPENNNVETVNLSSVPPRDILHHAAVLATQYESDKEKWTTLATEAKHRITDLMRECEFLRLELLEAKNNLQASASQCETLRQEASDLRAFFSSVKAQFEHFEIPLPIRIRAKQENKHVKKSQVAAPGGITVVDHPSDGLRVSGKAGR